MHDEVIGGGLGPTRSVAWTPGEIFQLIREEPRISRSQLARQTGLSPSTVTARVEGLLDVGYVREHGTSKAGRRPRALSVNPEWGVVLAAHLGSRHTRACVVDMNGHILTSEEVPIGATEDVEASLAWLRERMDVALASIPPNHPPLRGVGVSVSAPVDTRTGQVVGATLLRSWNRVEIAPRVRDWFGVPVVVDNDGTLMARGEHRSSRPEVGSLIYLKLGSAIGCGIIVKGNVHRGHSGGAGEIGHMPIESPFSRPCSCGRTNCLEATVGGGALIEHLRDRGHELSSTAELVALVEAGDPDALEIVKGAGTAIGSAAAILADFFNPEAIVLGGKLSSIEPLTQSLKAAVFTRSLPLALHGVKIDVSISGEHAATLGAAWTVIDHLFAPDAVDAMVADSSAD